MSTSSHRWFPARQCDQCPWRVDAVRGLFSPERFESLRICEDAGGPLFACHKSVEGNDLVCAGWLEHQRKSGHNIRARIAVARYQPFRPPEILGPSFESYNAMAAAHGEAWQAIHEPLDPDDGVEWLECPECGHQVLASDGEGRFVEDDEQPCLHCGTICAVALYESHGAHDELVVSAEAVSRETAVDVGQPRCDGTCDRDWVRKPCTLDCPRAGGFGPLVELDVETLSTPTSSPLWNVPFEEPVPSLGPFAALAEAWIARIEDADDDRAAQIDRIMRSGQPISWLEQHDLQVVIPTLKALSRSPVVLAAVNALAARAAKDDAP